jgi:hypothetical protein
MRQAESNGLSSIQRPALIVGVLGLAVCALGVFLNSPQFFRSYLYGYLFWINVTLGCFSILMLHHLVGGGWGFAIQRLLEAGAWLFPLMALLFLPLLFGMKDLYLWARPDEVAHDVLLQHKQPYLNVPFFLIRSLFYFLAWMGVAYLLNRWSLRRDETGDMSLTRRIKLCSGFGLVVYGGTVTFASVDWVMSLEPHWFSTIYGVIFIVGNALTTLALMIIVLGRLSTQKPLADLVSPQHFHDLGNLMLAFVMLWAYIAFSQYIIIWSGNLPEEATWYVHRMTGGWQSVAMALIGFHFIAPFLLLLSRNTKRRTETVSVVAGAMILMRLIDLFWLVMPSFHKAKFHIHWLDFAAPIGIGGVWLAAFIWQVQKRPLLPLRDPRLDEILSGIEHG